VSQTKQCCALKVKIFGPSQFWDGYATAIKAPFNTSSFVIDGPSLENHANRGV